MKIDRKNDVSLRLLEIFGTMMRCQTTVQAAEELGISQPAVSTGIRQLEAQLGVTLFQRANRRLQPTEEARAIFMEIEPIFTQLRSFESRVRDVRSGNAGRLRIMATPPLGHTIVPLALKRFLSERGELSVFYDVRRLDSVIEAVEMGTVDIGLALGLEGHPAVNVSVLERSDMVALVVRGHPLESEAVITPKLAAEHGLIGIELGSRLGQQLQRSFESAGVGYHPRVEVRYCHTAAVLASTGLGVAIVDRFTARFLSSFAVTVRPFSPTTRIASSLLTRLLFPPPQLAADFAEEVRRAIVLATPSFAG
ncbi:LysR family transcriptional regulator [Consotaella salsifontis]|uniref:DNA-binding transcriptional regulator, LysR family n=1 Tax=Consotaella salsifontis TaxID=1365950 RepID=A0A1T4SG62_9HYPH|nr:LysR family transcriptional regulator [Consotaella salsifontis]SKA27185.1 DNA-binding transcriptional regulator, LysR family [Consotaella salsifontis]